MCLRRMFYRLDLVTPRGCCQRVSGGEYRSRSVGNGRVWYDRPTTSATLSTSVSAFTSPRLRHDHLDIFRCVLDFLIHFDCLTSFDLRIRSNSVHFFHSSVHPRSRLHPHRLHHYFTFHSGLKHRVATSLGEKKSRTFQGHSSTFSRLISSDVLLRCGHIKSNRINFVLLTVVTTQQVRWCTLAPLYA